jgi:alpha-beta hydrolase superfamily lysophospholipase
MIHSESGWKTEDGLNIYSQIWRPEGEVKAVVCLVHGLGEHSSRYEPFSRYMAARGYAVYGYDLRGHGKSEGKRGHTPSYEAYLSDIAKLLQKSKEAFPGKNIFLFGHSMGGNLVINYVLHNNPNIKGVILTGPWLKQTHPPNKFMIKTAEIIDKLYPGFRTHNRIKSENIVQEDNNSNEPQTKHEKDPMLHPWITIHTYLTVRQAGIWALENASRFKYPLLLMHGSSDKVTSPEGSTEFAGKLKCKYTLKIWDDLSHKIHIEPLRNEIYSFIYEWVEGQSGSTLKSY